MSFSTDIRLEIIRSDREKQCCVVAELTALLLNAGSVAYRGPNQYAVSIASEHAAVIRYAYEQIKLWLELSPLLRTVRNAQLGARLRYQLALEGGAALEFLDKLQLLDEKAPFGLKLAPSGALIRRDCCRRAYLRGAFLACGWVNRPDGKYHMEFAAPDEAQADALLRILRRCDVPAKAVSRKNREVVYVKEGERIALLLKLMGAHRAVFALEDARVLKEMRNTINRQVNCDARNLDMAIDAAQAQIGDIEYIRDRMGLDALPSALREIAVARMEHAEASLTELGALMSPPLGKSGVNNRLRRLSALARRLRSEA